MKYNDEHVPKSPRVVQVDPQCDDAKRVTIHGLRDRGLEVSCINDRYQSLSMKAKFTCGTLYGQIIVVVVAIIVAHLCISCCCCCRWINQRRSQSTSTVLRARLRATSIRRRARATNCLSRRSTMTSTLVGSCHTRTASITFISSSMMHTSQTARLLCLSANSEQTQPSLLRWAMDYRRVFPVCEVYQYQ